MDPIRIHGVPGSPFTRAALATLEEKKAPYRFVAVKPQQLSSPDYTALHPFGRVPVLSQGEFVLYETQAILRYIERLIPTPSLTPADVRDAARMDQLMSISDWYLFQGVANVIGFQRIVGPKLLGRPT